jgi:hypothetical protein
LIVGGDGIMTAKAMQIKANQSKASQRREERNKALWYMLDTT